MKKVLFILMLLMLICFDDKSVYFISKTAMETSINASIYIKDESVYIQKEVFKNYFIVLMEENCNLKKYKNMTFYIEYKNEDFYDENLVEEILIKVSYKTIINKEFILRGVIDEY